MRHRHSVAAGPEDRESTRRVSLRDLISFCDAMAMLIQAGNAIPEAIRAASGAIDSTVTSNRLQDAAARIENGMDLSTALRETRLKLPPFFSASISAVEISGRSMEIFTHLSTLLRRRQRIRNRLSGAMLYPGFVVILTIAECCFLHAYVGPHIGDPDPVIGGSGDSVEKSEPPPLFPAAAVIAGGTAIIGGALIRHGSSLMSLGQRLLRLLPLMGKTMTAVQMSVYCYTAGGFAECGLASERCFSLACRAVTDAYIRTRLEEAHGMILNGISPSQAFASIPDFPAVMAKWIGIGEHTGDTVKMFRYLHMYFETEVEKRIQAFEKAAEPVLILAAGGVLLLALLTSILPLFESFWRLPG